MPGVVRLWVVGGAAPPMSASPESFGGDGSGVACGCNTRNIFGFSKREWLPPKEVWIAAKMPNAWLVKQGCPVTFSLFRAQVSHCAGMLTATAVPASSSHCHSKSIAKDDFSEPPQRADSKNPSFIFCRSFAPGHLRGPGVSLGRILGGGSIEPPLFGGGLARGLYRTPPPPIESPPTPGATDLQ